jgi:RecJ-like exonuclease
MAQALKCPVCEGKRRVPAGFYPPHYTAGGSPYCNNSTGYDEPCRSCEGKGYVVVLGEKV